MDAEDYLEFQARLGWRGVVEVEPGVFTGSVYRYQDGVTTALLRSGKDGPHSKLADDVCSLRRDSV